MTLDISGELAGLPPVYVQRGTDPAFVRQELDYAIDAAITAHPRSAQKRIGPSEIGHSCSRRLAYRLAGVEPVNTDTGRWKPTVGTAVHGWLQEAIERENQATGKLRWLTETRVNVGEVADQSVTGSCDLYDRTTAGVIDWKIQGVASLRSTKANGPSEQYRIQAHLYGRGFVRAGLPVDWVAIYALPQNGERHEAVFWSEPYDESVAVKALERIQAIHTLVTAAGPTAAAVLPTSDAWCSYCPFYLPAATELVEACPGHDPTEMRGSTAA